MDALILIVEDQPLHAKLFVEVARANGMKAIATARGEEALKLMASVRPTLVLMDVYLPDGDGRHVIAHMRGDDRMQAIPVVAISALSDRDTIDGSLSAGADGFLSKPVSIKALSAELRRLAPPR
ncbi:MAG: response regulator [Sphingomonas adhaesiva]|uniref:response regulator n=1 Tax=Sphingomonas adhaesiva TaxID=28212 RepID=UPI002FF46BC9